MAINAASDCGHSRIVARHQRLRINCSVIVAVVPSPPRSRVRPTRAASVRSTDLLDALRRLPLADVLQHHRRRTQQRDRVGQPLAGDVRGAAVDRLEDRVSLPMLAPGTTPRPPTRPAHRSLITSPNRFSITSTS